ncbi:AAA family ATPase, partial [Streptomyces sp. NPDC050428]|uniref:AAA family ATPase n=1 Tax=Streptomyces sp. NPDC050428 TaxID=3155757 RepID=UPI0034475174
LPQFLDLPKIHNRQHAPPLTARSNQPNEALLGPVCGRDRQLADLQGLEADRDGGLVVVCGTGGLGKTTLAAQAAQQAETRGRAVFWVRWKGDAARLAQELGLAENRLQDAQNARAALVDVVWQ